MTSVVCICSCQFAKRVPITDAVCFCRPFRCPPCRRPLRRRCSGWPRMRCRNTRMHFKATVCLDVSRSRRSHFYTRNLGITSFNDMKALCEKDLASLGVTKIGHRNRIMKKIGELQSGGQAQPQQQMVMMQPMSPVCLNSNANCTHAHFHVMCF